MNDNRPKIKVAVTTTTSPSHMPILPNWLNWIENVLKTQCPDNISIEKSVVCASFTPNSIVRKADKVWLQPPKVFLHHYVGCSREKYWCKEESDVRGAGEIWRQACVFCFEPCECGQPNIKVDYVLHTPRDVDYNNPQPSDGIRNHIHKIFNCFKTNKESDYPDLVIGDYNTFNDPNGRIKNCIEEAVIEQLKHYFTTPNHIAIRKSITRPRSEFFLISEKLFNHVKTLWKEYPRDPMPIIMDFADRNGYKVEKKDLGTFNQTGSGYNAKNINDQILRTAFQIGLYWLREIKGYEPNDTLKITDKDKVLEGMKIAHDQLEPIFEIGFNSKTKLSEIEKYLS